MTTALGIDPGKNGAAVLLSDRQLLEAIHWKPRKKAGYYVTTLNRKFEVESLFELTSLFGTPDYIAVEALFVGSARQRIIGTAETAGELLGAIAATGCLMGRVARPMASRWRADLLRLPPRTSAAQCDAYAKQVVIRYFGESIAWKSGHAVDAACIALWASGLRGKR